MTSTSELASEANHSASSSEINAFDKGQASRPSSRTWKRLAKQRTTVAFSALLLVIIVGAIVGPWLVEDPNVGDLLNTNAPPSSQHLLGTDQLGRDVLSRLFAGGRVALLASLEAVGIAVLLGVPLGILFGFYGGRVDRVGMRIVEAIVSIPFLLLAIAVIGAFGPGLFKAMFIVGVVFSTFILRLARGQVLAEREQLYVDSAIVSGVSTPRIMFRHVLPNTVAPLIIQCALMFAGAILAEASLSFLGFGAQPPQTSWGVMLTDAQSQLRTNFFLAVPPGLMIFVTVLALTLVGDGLRDLFGRDVTTGNLGVRSVARTPASAASEDVAHQIDDVLLRVTDLSASFPSAASGRVNVVDNVSFEVGRGEILCLVGESGSGKSVTALSLIGLLADPGEATAKAIEFDGHELTSLTFDELRAFRGRQIGVVFQEPIACLNPTMTVGAQVAEVIRLHDRLSRRKARERVVELFERVQISNPQSRLDQYPHEFSGGMAQRVMIAMALACNPTLLIADEPTTALDVTVQGQILDLIVSLRDESGMSILLITHDLGVVADIADRVAVMYAGQVVESGRVGDIFARPAHPYTEGLLAAVPRNRSRIGRLPSIPGAVPVPSAWPVGCHFVDRCSYADAQCRTSPIPLTAINHRVVRCVRADELALVGVEDCDESHC